MSEEIQKPLRKFYNPSFRRLCVAFYDLRDGGFIFPSGQSEESVADFAEAISREQIDVIYCLHDGDTDLRSFVQTSLADSWAIDWTITEDVNGGRVSRGEQAIYISSLHFSYFPQCDDLHTAFEAYRALEKIFLSHQGEKPLNLTSSPTITGLAFLSVCLPVGKVYEPQDSELLDLIASYTTQSRYELLTLPPLKEIEGFYYYDARFMYAAAAFYELPCGTPTRDSKTLFEPYSVGWYRVRAEIPREWAHVGILPLRNPSEDKTERKWLFPSEPGFVFDDVWVTEPELRLAIKHKWSVEIKERMLWADKNAKPLRTWQQKIVAMRDEAARLPTEIRSHVRDALRAMLLNAIGSMGARKDKQSYDLNPSQFVAERRSYTPEIRASIKQLDDGDIRVVKPKTKSSYRAQFSRYEWTAYIWARSRVMLTERMLSVPRENVLGCRVDAVYLTCAPDWKDTGYPGQFVCKGFIKEKVKAPQSLNELHELRVRAESEVKE
jgi:hypothetical protein